jgi:hypothetical protein
MKAKRKTRDVSDWFPLFDPAQVQRLAERIDGAAASESERSMFRAVLRRAYDDVMELDVLNRQVPGVLGGDYGASEMFQRVLGQAANRGISSERTLPKDVAGKEHDRLHKDFPDRGLPCSRNPLIRPACLPGLARATRAVSGGDSKTLDVFNNTLRGLWRCGRPLNLLNRLASDGGKGGQDRLTDTLRLMGRGWNGSDSSWPSGGHDVPDGMPDPDFNKCEFLLDLCVDALIDGVADYTPASSFYATGITGLRPAHACAGEIVTIEGSNFGDSKPDNIDVVFSPGLVAVCVSWSDDAIEVRVPAGAESGCVAFKNTAQRSRDLVRDNRRIVDNITTALACMGGRGGTVREPVTEEETIPCLADGANHFAGILPDISEILVNGYRVREPSIVNENRLTLSWTVSNASGLQIERISSAGPEVDRTFTVPEEVAWGSVDLPPGIVSAPVLAKYRITARNACGERVREIEILLQTAPTLSIIGLEVTQSAQTFALDSDSPRNTAPLVERKRTAVRIYIDSGIDVRIDRGEQPDVAGEVYVFPAGARAWQIPSEGTTITARPPARIRRNAIDHTLNFELPLAWLTGTVTIKAKVWVTGHSNDAAGSGWMAESEMDVTFTRRRQVTVQPILVTDPAPVTSGTPLVGNRDFNRTLAGALARMPLAEDGFVVRQPTLDHFTTADLNTEDGWTQLLAEIDDLAGDSGYADGAIVIALIRDVPAVHAGITTQIRKKWEQTLFPFYWGWREFSGRPRVIVKPMGGPLAHELGHRFGLDHTPGCTDGPFDSRLPNEFILNEGFDVANQLVIGGLRSDIMGCQIDSWPSVTYWQLIFDALA